MYIIPVFFISLSRSILNINRYDINQPAINGDLTDPIIVPILVDEEYIL